MATYDNISVDEAIASAGQAQPTPPSVVQEVSTDPAQILFNSNGVEEKSVDELIAEGNSKAKEITGIDPSQIDPTLQEQIAGEIEASKKAGRKPKLKVDENTKTIISSLINDGVLKGFEDGKYETADDLKELITLNTQEKLESWQEEYAKNFYNQGGPIWGTILEASRTARTPQDLIPLLQVADDLDYSYSLNTDTDESCEEIIRATLAIKGMDLDTIESDIEDFKTRGVLKDRADKFKPTLDKYNEQRFEQIKYERHQQELQKQAFYNNHIDAVIKNVIEKEAPGGFKLKNDQKQYLAEMFVPNQEIGGLPIYNAIDHLLANSDYDTLTKVALLITDPGTFEKMYSGRVANTVAESLQRKLRDGKTSNVEENMMQQSNQPQRQKLTFSM